MCRDVFEELNHSSHDYRNRDQLLLNYLKQIEKETTPRGFLQRFRKLWEARGDKKEINSKP